MGALILICAPEQRIALEAHLAHALRRIGGRALGIDAAREAFAGTLALIVVLRIQEVGRRADALARLYAFLVAGALLVRGALALGRRTESVVGIALVALGAVAAVAAVLIDAQSSVGAQLGATLLALVDIHTAAVGLCLVALGAGAVADTARYRDALRPAGAGLTGGAAGQHAAVAEQLVRRLALALGTAADLAHDKRISGMALRAAALVAAGQILAQGIQAARGLRTLCGTLVHILTLATLRIALVALATNANTAACKRVLNTAFSRRTRIGIGAAGNLGRGTALGIGVSRGASGALAQIAAGSVGADGIGCAGIGAALVDVTAASWQCSVARVAGRAEALRLPIGQHALGMGTAVARLARMPAIVADIRLWAEAALGLIADGIAGALLVAGAADDGRTVHRGIRIGQGAIGAAAGVAASCHVDALSANATLISRSALIDVLALGVRITREARRTGAAVAAR